MRRFAGTAAVASLILAACTGPTTQEPPASGNSAAATPLHLASTPGTYQAKVVDFLQIEGRTYQATVYQPDGPGPFPALLDVHPGVWVEPVSRSVEQSIAKYLASYGVVVVLIDFRQDHQHHYPDSVADVNYAIRWLKANAQKFNASSRPLGALGSSSGGHLVMLDAMRPDDPRYASVPLPGGGSTSATLDYVVGHSPILAPVARRAFAVQTNRNDLVKDTDEYFPAAGTIDDADPQLILDRHEKVSLPPALIIQGTADANIDYRLLERFAKSYEGSGGTVQLEEFPGAAHVFMTAGGSDADKALAIVRDFIANQLSHVR